MAQNDQNHFSWLKENWLHNWFIFLKSTLVAASLSNTNVQSAMGKSEKITDPPSPNAEVVLHKVNAGTRLTAEWGAQPCLGHPC